MKYKIKIAFLLLLCLLRYVAFGTATKKQKTLGKVIIFQGAKLGDMVCTTPIFRAVKAKYPECKIIVIGNSINKHLLEYNADVDGYIVHRDESFFSTIKKIRREGVDFGCITGPGFLNLAILYLAGVPLIAAPEVKDGYSPLETRSYNILRKLVEVQPHHMGQYAPREYLRLLEIIDIYTENTKKHLAFSGLAAHHAEEVLKPFAGKFIVGISPSAGNKIKEWPATRFAEVANYVAEKYGAIIVIIGSKDDRGCAEDMKRRLSKKTVFLDAVGMLSIDELKAVIARLNVFISVDTGPIYIAEAFGVPTIDIVGPMDEKEQPPIGKFHKVVVAPRKTAQLHIMSARLYDKKEARRQVESITSVMVCGEIDALIQELKIVVG